MACFSSDSNTPTPSSTDCHAGSTGSVELPCRDASLPLDDAAPALDAMVDGRVPSTLPQGYGGPAAVVVQSTGAMLIAVVGGPSADTFNVVRLTSTGQLDTSHGTGGIASVSFFGEGDDAVALSLMADDSVLVGGNVQTPLADAGYDISELGLTHLLAGGGLDTSFGTAGKLFLQIPNETEGSYWAAQLLQSNGALFAVGAASHLDDAW